MPTQTLHTAHPDGTLAAPRQAILSKSLKPLLHQMAVSKIVTEHPLTGMFPSGVARTSTDGDVSVRCFADIYSRDLHYFDMSECRILGAQ